MIEAHYVITDVIDDTDYEGVGCGTTPNGSSWYRFLARWNL